MTRKWLQSENIRLRAPEPEDLELMYLMENDTTLWSVGNTLLPYSRHTLRLYIKQTAHDLYAERQARFVIETQDGEAIGMIDLADYDPVNSRAEVCIALLSQYRKQGFATAALQLLCEYAMKKLHLHQLYAYIPEKMKKAIPFSQKTTLKKVLY